MKTFAITWVPHIEPVVVEVQASNWAAALKKFNKQVCQGRGPIFEELRACLHEELLGYANERAKPRLEPCPCKR